MKAKPNKKQLSHFWFAAIVGAMAIFYSLLSIFIYPGYTNEREDQAFYIAPLMQKVDPELYPRDFLMENPQTGASLFDEIIAPFLLHDTENIFRVLFIFTFFLRAIFFIGIMLIAYAVSDRKLGFSLLFPLLFIIGSVGVIVNAYPPKSWFYSFETELHARSFAFSLGTLALGLFLLGKRIAGYLIASLALLIHMLSALPLLLFFAVTTFLKNILHEKNYRAAGLFLIPVIAFMILLVAANGQSGTNMDLFAIVDPEWKSFMAERTPWLFYLTVNLTQTMFLYIPLTLFFLLTLTDKHIPAKISGKIALLGITVFLLQVISVIGFNRFGIAIFGQLQLFRALYWLEIVLAVCLLFICFEHIVDGKSRLYERLLFTTLFLLIPFGSKMVLFPVTVILVLLAIAYNLQESKRLSSRLIFSLVLFGIIFFISSLWHPVARAQMLFLKTFFVSLINDPLLAFGLATQWIKMPLLVLAVLLILIRLRKISKPVAKNRIRIFVGILMILSGSLVLANTEKIIEFMRPPSQRNTGVVEWIAKNVGNDDLVFVGTPLEDLGLEIRNHAGKNIFVTRADGAQGMFNREYALEWKRRRNIEQSPTEHWEELTKTYRINYIASLSDENFPGEIVYQDQQYRVTRISN